MSNFGSWFLISTGARRNNISYITVMPLSGRLISLAFDFSGALSLVMAMICQVSL